MRLLKRPPYTTLSNHPLRKVSRSGPSLAAKLEPKKPSLLSNHRVGHRAEIAGESEPASTSCDLNSRNVPFSTFHVALTSDRLTAPLRSLPLNSCVGFPQGKGHVAGASTTDSGLGEKTNAGTSCCKRILRCGRSEAGTQTGHLKI